VLRPSRNSRRASIQRATGNRCASPAPPKASVAVTPAPNVRAAKAPMAAFLNLLVILHRYYGSGAGWL